MVVPKNQGFPAKNDHFGVFWGYNHFRKPPYGGDINGLDGGFKYVLFSSRSLGK